MAHSLSAKKRVRQNIKSRVINRSRKSVIKTQIKHFQATVAEGNLAGAQEQYKALVRKLDKVSFTSTIHKNTAARIKSRVARRLNQLKTKSAG